MVPVNYLAIIVSAVAAMVLGFLWFGPLFGKEWIRLMGIPDEKVAEMKAKGMKSMASTYAFQAAGALLMAFVLAHALIFASTYLKAEGISAGLQAGFWNWLGFVAPVTLGSVLWEGKPWKLWVLNAGYYLVTLLVMGVILALWV